MKRQCNFLLPVLLIICLLGGCARQEEEEETGYLIYYNSVEGTQLQNVSYTPVAESFEELMEELAGELAQAPSGYVSVLGNDVRIQGYQRGIDALRIDFSEEYYGLDSVEEVMLRAAVVKTFSQIPGVTKIMITVDGEQLVDSDGQPVPAMDRDDFINTREGGINSYQYVTLSLYFVDSESGKLRRESRNLHYSSNMVLENVVAEQLILGPDSDDLAPVFVNTVRILGVHMQDGICVIDFDDAVNEWPAGCTADAETVVYALVNSICDTCDDVEGVRIRIDGENDAVFRDGVPLNQVFYLEMSQVEDYTEADASAAVFSTEETQASGEVDAADDSERSGGADAAAQSGNDMQQISGSAVASGEMTGSADEGAGETVIDSEEEEQNEEIGQTEPPEENAARTERLEASDGESSSEEESGGVSSGGRQNGGGLVGVDPMWAGE